MTTDHASQVVGASSAATVGFMAGLPNPIATAMYALIAAVVGWIVTWALNWVKNRLGL